MALIDTRDLFKCETCFHTSPRGCVLGSFACDHGEAYRPAINRLNPVTLDDIRPHGRWIKKGPRCVCGECKQGIKANLPSMDIWLDLSTLPFFPNCGAKMDKEEDHA